MRNSGLQSRARILYGFGAPSYRRRAIGRGDPLRREGFMSITQAAILDRVACENSVQPLIDKAAVGVLFGNRRATLVGNVTTAFLVVLALWFDGRFGLPEGLWWVGVVFGVDYLRFLLGQQYELRGKSNPLGWARAHMWGTCLQGAVWSLAGFFLIPFDSPTLPALYLVITAATTAGSLSLNATYMPSLRGYMWVKLGGLSLRLLIEPEFSYWVLSAAVAFYCVFLVRLGKKLHEVLLSSYQLRFSRENLVARLSEAQLDLQQSHEELELRVKERTQSLEQETSTRIEMERRLHRSQRMEAVGRLTGGIAHDFNNNLAVILNCLEHVETELNRPLTSIQTAKHTVMSSAALTKSLLVFSRQTDLVASMFDLRSVVQDMSCGILRRALPSNIKIVVDCPSHRVMVKVDQSQLESTLLNLALNARDAMLNGGELKICVTSSPKHANIVVADSGCGIPSEVLDRVFEPFFSTKGEDGTGLGLSMVYGFVCQSGGDVSIKSGADGTSVEIDLPRVEPESISEPLSSPDSLSIELFRGSGETILLVEDNDSLRESTEMLLARIGYRVVQVCDGESALHMLQTHDDIRLVLTDVRMPGEISGYCLAQEISRKWPHIRTIVMTGYAPDVPKEVKNQLVHKPFTMLELAKSIKQALCPDSARSMELGCQAR